MEFNINACAEAWWKEVGKKVNNSSVFVDDRIAECLYWNGGLAKMLKSGAKTVKSLSPFEKASHGSKKAVFVTSSYLLPDSNGAKSIKSIIKNSSSQLEYCIVITIASHACHALAAGHSWNGDDSTTGTPRFDEFEKLLLDWMGSPNLTAEVFHFSLFTANLADDCFLTLSFTNLYPKLDEANFTGNFDKLSENLKQDVHCFVACLNSLLNAMDIREDIFCCGPFSSLVATRLSNLQAAKNRRKNAKNAVKLVIVDRSADLITPLSSGKLSALDWILSNLPAFAQHTCERRVSDSETDHFHPPYTLFSHANDPEAQEFLQHFVEKPVDIAVELANLKLNSYAKANGIQRTKSDENNSETLKILTTQLGKLVLANQMCLHHRVYSIEIAASVFDMKLLLRLKPLDSLVYKSDVSLTFLVSEKTKQSLSSNGVLQLCRGLALSLSAKGPFSTERWTEISKIVNESAKSQQPLATFATLTSRHSFDLSDHLLGLLLLYLNCGVASWQWSTVEYEKVFEKAANSSSHFKRSNNLNASSSDRLARLIEKLKNYARLQDAIPLKSRSSDKPYLADLVERLMKDSDNTTLPELSNKSSTGLSGALKSTLSIFGGMPSISQQPTDYSIIVFVVGGITCYELTSIRSVLKTAGVKHPVLLGSTKLITNRDIFENLLF